MALESAFQKKLKAKLRRMFPDCILLKGASEQIQGIPDLIIIWQDRWAFLEVKRSSTEVHQPNQDYYVDFLGSWSYAAFIFPENEERILDELQQALGARRVARVSQRV